MSNQDNPLITFVLLAYNQEKYIREAIAGAFSQTYSPLQIILSDDCSTDKTFEIMKEEAKKYSALKSGNKIIINRNAENQGIGGHINKAMTLAEADLIVVAAGDDISLPERVESIYKTWAQNNFVPASIHSAYYEIDESGASLGLQHAIYKNDFRDIDDALSKHFSVHGASHAWHKDVFSVFGPMRNDVIYEDRVIPVRSMLLGGGVIYIDAPLIQYRTSVGVSGNYAKHSYKEALFGVRAERLLIAHKQQHADIQKHLGDTQTTKIALNLIKRQEFLLKFRENLSTTKRVKLIVNSLKSAIGSKLILRALLVYYAPSIFGYIILMKNKLSNIKSVKGL